MAGVLAAAGQAVLFEDLFEVIDVDPDGKKFDRVSRFVCRGENYEMALTLDVNVDVYPLTLNTKFALALASTLSRDGKPDQGVFDQSGESNLADDYEYVMHGKVFKVEQDKTQSSLVSVYVSFGGLLMLLRGDPRNLASIEIDTNLYLLMRKA